MWRICVWFLGLFRRRKPENIFHHKMFYLDPEQYPMNDGFAKWVEHLRKEIKEEEPEYPYHDDWDIDYGPDIKFDKYFEMIEEDKPPAGLEDGDH